MKPRLKLSPNLADIYNMETGDQKNLAKLQKDYQDLVSKISKFRNEGKEPPFELIIQAHEVGHLAHIPESQLYKLLRG
jgi:predicted transcriptional regulator